MLSEIMLRLKMRPVASQLGTGTFSGSLIWQHGINTVDIHLLELLQNRIAKIANNSSYDATC